MGKKRVIQKTKEEVLKEREAREALLKKGVKVKAAQKIKEGKVYISSSFNNTFLTLTDPQGNVLFWTSAGKIGFKGTRKGTPFAASKAVEPLIEAIEKLGIEKISVLVKGVGAGRDSALRSLANLRLEISSIKDMTPMPHNGCRPRKPRRV